MMLRTLLIQWRFSLWDAAQGVCKKVGPTMMNVGTLAAMMHLDYAVANCGFTFASLIESLHFRDNDCRLISATMNVASSATIIEFMRGEVMLFLHDNSHGSESNV
jgi:hypothetical protein